MITVKTEIGENGIRYTWDKRIGGLRGNSLWIEYDVDVSKTPRHLANLMFGLIVSDPMSWENETMVFDELTQEGLSCLTSFLKMYHYSKGYGGHAHDYGEYFPEVRGSSFGTDKLVIMDEREDTGPVLCANGLGKDGITISSMTKELGFNMRCFFLAGQMTRKVMVDRWDTMNKYYRMRGIESDVIRTNFFKIQGKVTGTYPYFFAIPLAFHYDSEAILAGISIHQNKTLIGSWPPAFYSPGETSFSFNYTTKGSGIRFSSPNRPLSLYAVNKLLVERYRDSLKYQRSCTRGSPWCNKCPSCYRNHLWIMACDIEAISIGANPRRCEDKDFYWGKNVGAFGFSSNTALNALKKLYGEPYESWIEEGHKTAIDLMWRGGDYEGILTDHFGVYDYDREDDGFGWSLKPTQWREINAFFNL